MIKTITSPRFLFVGTLILIAAISRLLPHPDNFTPIAAMALFGGAHLSKRYAILLPLAAMLLSDLFLGTHNTMLAVYFSMAIIAGIGILISKQINIQKVVGATLAGSILFYLITNFAVWYGSPYYPQSFAGLVASYEAGIPFFRYTLLGDFCYSAILFGSYYFAKQRFPKLAV